ncbi:hypothetical protein [Aliikangiella sp. IMCC44359]|uniref:hypothetical protein n=1 Tax=Aliikangiella sp. IMCC44359 TaxID=3459125 RepID=UPI00403B2520
MKKYLFFLLAALVSLNVQAGNAWYWGKVIQINTSGNDGSFEILIDNPNIENFCSDKLVFFKASNMGAERTKAALSLAVAAFMGGKEWGVVVDLPSSVNRCDASPTASQGAGIR